MPPCSPGQRRARARLGGRASMASTWARPPRWPPAGAPRRRRYAVPVSRCRARGARRRPGGDAQDPALPGAWFWVYRQTQWVALMTTALDLSVEQIVEYYAARWKIEIYQTWCLRTDKVTWKKPRSPHRRRHDAVGSRSVAPGVSRASAQARWHRPRSATADGRHARPGVPAGGLCRAS